MKQQQYIIAETAFNHVVAALRDNRQYDVAEYLIHEARPAPQQPARLCCSFDLQAYSKDEIEYDDIHECNGKVCNYCGRFNEPYPSQSQQERAP